jgi:hypothetical protein
MEMDPRPTERTDPSPLVGRLPSENLAARKARNSDAVMDDDFTREIETALEAHRYPWNPPSWE